MNSLGFRVVAMLFRKLTGTQFTIVPYRAAGDLVADVMAGRIDLNFGTLPSTLQLMRAGSEKLYAVTSDRRSTLAPEIPTFAEMGLPAMTYSSWYGVFTPKGTPKDFISKLNAAVVDTLADPAVRSRLLGYEIFPRERQTAEALAGLQKADAEKWWPLIRELGIKAE
jgi:tripartite-type tricarboxylate transporter receptor subunit TctC